MGMVRIAKVISLKVCKAVRSKHPALDTSDRAQVTTREERDLLCFAWLCGSFASRGRLWFHNDGWGTQQSLAEVCQAGSS